MPKEAPKKMSERQREIIKWARWRCINDHQRLPSDTEQGIFELIDTTRFLKYMENKYHKKNFKLPSEKILTSVHIFSRINTSFLGSTEN